MSSFPKSIFSPNNGGGRIYLIQPEIVVTTIEFLLASLSFSPTFLLCAITASIQVFFGQPLFLVLVTLKSNALHKIVLILSQYTSILTDTVDPLLH